MRGVAPRNTVLMLCFFFSSRRRHTRSKRDWSSDVCSSDLAELLLSGDTARGGEYLDLLEHAGTIPAESTLAARFAAFQSFRYGVVGQLEKSVQAARAAQAIQECTELTDEWNAAIPLILLRVYSCLDDFPAVEREAAAALAAPEITEPVKLVMVPGSLALAQFESG